MRKKILIIILFVLLTGSITFSQDETEPSISAKACVLIDCETGEIIYDKNRNLPLIPASTLKVLTAYIVLQNQNLNQVTQVSSAAASQGGSTSELRAGQKVSILDLLYGLLLPSGNDAAYALAEYTSGSAKEFVKLMNKTARSLGMFNTVAVDPHGLSEYNRTTAEDLAILTREAMKIPLFNQIISTQKKSIEVNNSPKLITNHNKLLFENRSYDGVKTGYTSAAGKTFIGSQTYNGKRLLTVVLKTTDAFKDAETLLFYGFSKYN